MPILHAAVAALNTTPLDWENNASVIKQAIAAARKQGVQLLCLPELCITGYGCEDMFLAPHVSARALLLLAELAPETGGMVVSLGLPVFFDGAVYNSAALLVDGKVVGAVGKKNLAGDGVHYEPRWFKPLPAGTRGKILVGGAAVPFGDLYFSVDGVKIGFEICEDAWVDARPGADLAAVGVDIILNPSASHFAFGKSIERRQLCLGGSEEFGCAYLYSNLLGNEAGRIVYDGDSLICASGELLAESSRFSFSKYTLTTAQLDLAQIRARRKSMKATKTVLQDAPAEIVVAGKLLSTNLATNQATPAAITPATVSKHDEFTSAVTLGLYDYLRKSGSKGFVISLSGGVDSGSSAILVTYMVHRALREIGAATLSTELGMPELKNLSSPKDLTRRLLSCVYQQTRNSSEQTQKAASDLASELSCSYASVDIDETVDQYVTQAGALIGEKLSWAKHDLALQNIQARVRAPLVWLLANLTNALLLTTSNRSEAAVGYTTMDGDTAGGLNPIGGIDKAYLLEWTAWVRDTGPSDLFPVRAAALLLATPPTAELRPKEKHQTDEADLMPYRVLNVIERFAILDKLPPAEVTRETEKIFMNEWSGEQIRKWTSRFFTLWSRNQWKRERYAPSFHLDDKSLDPKTWCRFPILSGGFKVELEDL